MAKKKPTTKKKSVTLSVVNGESDNEKLTEVLPAPPPGRDEETLSVDIQKQVAWRIKLGLLSLESQGAKTTKKKFVESALVAALDKLDQELGGANG